MIERSAFGKGTRRERVGLSTRHTLALVNLGRQWDSGGEHLISHALDIRADADGDVHDLHGREVGVATIFVVALYERMLSVESPPFNGEALDFDREGWGRLGLDWSRPSSGPGRSFSRRRLPNLGSPSAA